MDRSRRSDIQPIRGAGSIDLLAFHPASGIVLVVEIKTMIADLQGLLRPIDAKVRLAIDIAHDLGWTPRDVVPALVVADASTARRRVAAHVALFSRFVLRGRAARRWLAGPEPGVSGVLVFVDPSRGTSGAASQPWAAADPTPGSAVTLRSSRQ